LEVDLRQVLRSVRRWWWIAILCPALIVMLAFLYTSRQLPMYEAQAKLLVDPSGNGQSDYNTILSAERMTKTYEKLVKNRQVLEHVVTNLSLPFSTDVLSGMISAKADGDTQLLIVSVADTEPERAAQIANEVAEQFAAYVRDTSSSSSGETLAQLNTAIAEIETKMDETEAEIAELETGPDANSATVEDQLATLNATLDQYGTTHATLIITRSETQVRQAITVDPVKVFEPAFAPSAPFAPQLMVNLVLAIIAGGIVSTGVILLLEYLDNTVKVTADFTTLIGGPLLAAINIVPKLAPGRKQLFVLDQPKGTAAEAIRLLRTNIEFASATREIATLGITSPNPGEGKSTVAANLAVTLAQAGFVTALIDADLRRPTQHRLFETGNERGLSTLLTMDERPWSWAARDTRVPNLSVIPAGPLPPNPADLLSLERLRQILAEMRTTFDVIVVDTPPVLAVSDPLIIAAHVDGMIVVTNGGKTRLDALKRTSQTLQRGAIRVIGVVINQQGSKSKDGYYYTEYHAVEEKIGNYPRRRGQQSDMVPPVELKPSQLEHGTPAD
jgi:capsular exopolysaccharide synthesis family protein